MFNYCTPRLIERVYFLPRLTHCLTLSHHLDLNSSLFLSEDESPYTMTILKPSMSTKMDTGENGWPLLSLPLAARAAQSRSREQGKGSGCIPPVGNETTSELVYYGGVVGRVSVGVEAGHCEVFFY